MRMIPLVVVSAGDNDGKERRIAAWEMGAPFV